MNSVDGGFGKLSKLISAIENSGSPLPPRAFLYGGPGVGKTTAAALSYSPVVASTEDGLGLLEVNAFPLIENFSQFKQAIKELIEEDHEYRTLVVDSIDGIEAQIGEAVCAKHGKEFMSDFPYYRGNIEAVGWLEHILHDLDDLRRKKKMQIILISHAVRNTVEDPTVGAFDRMEPNLYKKAVPMVVSWADIVGFMDHERVITNKGGKESSKTVRTSRMSGSRFIHFDDSGAFIAKNRRGLPPQIEISANEGWSAVEKAMKAAQEGNKE